MVQEECLSERQKDGFCIATILGIIFVRFFQTLVLSKSISKLFLIAHWDSLFYPLRLGQNLSMDPSLVQQAIPNRFFVSHLWHYGIPLWNGLSGFGMPLLADPQAFVFSPTELIFNIFPCIHTWELVLILKLAIGAVSTYFLCRQLELNSVGSLVAALLFIFCPWAQWQLELLGKGVCFAPFVFLMFIRLAKRNSFWSAVLAGIAAAMDIFISHPEIAFITILSATALEFLVAYYNDCSKFNFGSNFYKIVVAGLVAFGITAPMLIPFCEYLINGESYKTALVASTGLPLQEIMSNYLFPFYAKGSLFFGPLSWWGFAAALCFLNKSNRFVVPMIVGLCVSVIAVTRFTPFDALFSIPPLSMAFATYCLPEYILFVSIVSGLGISYLFSKANRGKWVRMIVMQAIVLILCTIPLLFSHWYNNIRFDQTFGPPCFSFKLWLFNAASVAIMVSAYLVAVKKSVRWATVGSFVFITLGIANLIFISLPSLPLRPSFQYPTQLPIKIDTKDNGRVLSIGNHLLKPDINLLYQLPMLQVLNPLQPKGYLEFIKACGGQVDQYTQTFPLLINRLLNVTGVRTILSTQPILDEEVLPDLSKLNGKSVEYAGNCKLDKVQLFFDAKSRAVFCHLQVAANAKQSDKYHICLALEDVNGKPVSFIEPIAITNSAIAQEIYCSGFVPEKVRNWQVCLKILRDGDCTFISPIRVPFGSIRTDGTWRLGTNSKPKLLTTINNDRFKLTSNAGDILVYEDTKALPREFFVRRIKWVETPEKALPYMQAHVDALNDLVVLDDKQKDQFYTMLSGIQSISRRGLHPSVTQAIVYDNSGSIKRIPGDFSKQGFKIFPGFALHTDADQTTLLVISDLYYPGWKVYMDGAQWKMFRADSLFQAILLPPGQHFVRIEYRPDSFLMGVAIFMITILALLVCVCGKIVLPKTMLKPRP